MKHSLYTIIFLCLFILQGCMSTVQKYNPFVEPSPLDPLASITTSFENIYVPAIMELQKSRSNTYQNFNNSTLGSEIYTGIVYKDQLATFMAKVMLEKGWQLITAQKADGKELQLYEGFNKFVVLEFFHKPSVGVQIWVDERSPDGEYLFGVPLGVSDYNNPNNMDYSTPNNSTQPYDESYEEPYNNEAYPSNSNTSPNSGQEINQNNNQEVQERSL